MQLIPPVAFRHFRFMAFLGTFVAAMLSGAASAEPASRPSTTQPTTAVPKNIIVMVADGTGYSLQDAARFWSGKPLIIDAPGWGRLSMATYSLRRTRQPLRDVAADAQDPAIVYDPQRHYDPTPIEGAFGGSEDGAIPPFPRGFAGYELHRRTYPDSANTASAMMSGVSSYNGAINIDGRFERATTVAEIASAHGKRVGVVSSVPYSHATPAAAGGAHNESRGNYREITDELLSAGVVDVLAGAGHPAFDDDARPRETPVFTYINEADWSALLSGTLKDDKGQAWTLVQELAEIKVLATGETPDKLFIVPTVAHTLQQKRSSPDRTGDGRVNSHDALHAAPGDDPLTPGLPTLVDLTNAALNAVDDGESGFFLMIEGGATDWASHDTQLGRAIEEYIEFNAAIERVCAYLNNGTNGNSWENTLVIVTSDHDHLLMGPDGDTVPFQPLVDNGPGQMPGHRWLFGSHSNQLVPLYFRGAGSERIQQIQTKLDAFDDGTHRFGRGKYFHQIELGKLLKELVQK